MMRNVAGSSVTGVGVGATTLTGGGKPGDPTILSREYNDELESVGVGDMPPALHAAAPLSLLLALREEHSFSEYPFAFLVALALPPEAAARYAELSRGRCSS